MNPVKRKLNVKHNSSSLDLLLIIKTSHLVVVMTYYLEAERYD